MKLPLGGVHSAQCHTYSELNKLGIVNGKRCALAKLVVRYSTDFQMSEVVDKTYTTNFLLRSFERK